jgi:hypothetical protein
VPWCHFDRWFALVAVTSFDGDLDALEHELVGRLHSSLHGRTDVEAKLSHLAHLRGRMAAAGVSPAVLAGADEPDQATLSKARRKVLDQDLEGRAMTESMRDTPRVRLERRARYGRWDQFPVSPSRWFEKLAGRRPATHVTKGSGFAVTRQLRVPASRRSKDHRLSRNMPIGLPLVLRETQSPPNFTPAADLPITLDCRRARVDITNTATSPGSGYSG